MGVQKGGGHPGEGPERTEVRYELPNGSKRQYKCNGRVEPACRQKISDLNQTLEKFFK